MFKSKFTLKIVLLSILPILLFSFFSFLLLSQKIEQLSDNTSKISGDALSTIYRQIIENKSEDITAKIELKFNTLLNELNTLRGGAQQLIDGEKMSSDWRYFDTKLQEIWNEYRRVQQPISILMIDVDLFKKYNDCYGHQAGDACLRSVASRFKYELKRSNDVIARYGGEEFVIICCCNHVDALKLAEKMGEAIRKLSLEHIASEKNIVTISIGVASMIPSKEKDPLTLIQEADSALYESKKLGRDTVCGSTSLDHYSHS